MVRSALAAIFLGLAAGAKADDGSRRLFDFAPVSIQNPVVARIDGKIDIPLSELRAYQKAEYEQAIKATSNLDQKRAVLNALIDQYLYVDECYRNGIDRSPAFLKEMEATRVLILTDLVTPQDPKEARKMGDRLFDAADVIVYNAAWALLRKVAMAIDANRTPDRREFLGRIVKSVPEAQLVHCGAHSLRVQNVALIYAGMVAPRPDLQTEDGVVQMIKPLLIPELMADEAEKEGIDSSEMFKQQLLRNENALLRFHLLEEIEREASRMLENDHSPLPLKAERSVQLFEQLTAQKSRQLRKEHRVLVDDAALGQL